MAPSSETSSAGRLKTSWLMVGMPTSGEMIQPATSAPTTPTMTLRRMPYWALVRMTMLATQPMRPPTRIQRMKFIACSP